MPDEFEEMGRRRLEGIASVGGKQGVYVDIGNFSMANAAGMLP